MLKNIKYFDNDIQHGIRYDWQLIEKEMEKLNIPQNVVSPHRVHKLGSGKWIVDLSERSVGKTTNWLLLALVMNNLYGTTACYVRERVDMIMPKHSANLFKTIIENGYISQITNGQYDNYKYKSRAYYYYSTEKDELSSEPFMYALSIDENELNKSSFNAPRGDLIIFDEFISHYNYQNEFVNFCDTCKTIIRERDSALIVLLANTIDKHHVFFNELGIYRDVQEMKINDVREITANGGTIIEVALLGTKIEDMPKHRRKHNEKFFGFTNPLLNSIRGGDWAIKMYPHLVKQENANCLLHNRYIEHNGYLLNIELWQSDLLGSYVNVHIANKTYDDSVIFTLDKTLKSNKYRYKYGFTKIDKLYWDLLNRNKWFYATNQEGSIVENYVQIAQRKKIFD